MVIYIQQLKCHRYTNAGFVVIQERTKYGTIHTYIQERAEFGTTQQLWVAIW